jgi:hypothetical protein
LLKSALYFTAELSFVPRSVANVLYHLADFFSIQIFFWEKRLKQTIVMSGGCSPDPVLVLNLDPGLNLDPSVNPDLVTNSDPVANLDPVEYRFGFRIHVRINLATNPDQFSLWQSAWKTPRYANTAL